MYLFGGYKQISACYMYSENKAGRGKRKRAGHGGHGEMKWRKEENGICISLSI
jgi:hypothetical protein